MVMGTCIHGQNQRQCDRCEDAAEKAKLLADLAAMRKERDELRANRDRYSDLLDISQGVVRELRQRIAVAEAQSVYHPDDAAVDRFADAMKAKMAASRAKGRAGWENTDICPPGSLQRMLTDHLAKGDPVDVGNFAMMIFNRGESTNAPSAAVAVPAVVNEYFTTGGQARIPFSLPDAAVERIYDNARRMFRNHVDSTRGQQITQADYHEYHIINATLDELRATIDNYQPTAPAQDVRDAEIARVVNAMESVAGKDAPYPSYVPRYAVIGWAEQIRALLAASKQKENGQ